MLERYIFESQVSTSYTCLSDYEFNDYAALDKEW